jgi:hypothetical protein
MLRIVDSMIPMSADIPLLYLLVKMIATASVVVTASLVAEKTGPLIAAMVATLPVSAGPIYFFLALDHDAAFISTALLGSMGSNFATTAFSFIYVFAAQRFGMAASLAIAFAAWAPVLIGFRFVGLDITPTMILVLLLFPAAHFLAKPYLAARPKNLGKLAWYAIPVRALFVALLVATVTTLSTIIGPEWSGFFATFPVVLSTLIIFLHPRFGGAATGAIIGNSILGLMGFGVGLGIAHLIALPLGKWWALVACLLTCMIWNLALVFWSRRSSAQA